MNNDHPDDDNRSESDNRRRNDRDRDRDDNDRRRSRRDDDYDDRPRRRRRYDDDYDRRPRKGNNSTLIIILVVVGVVVIGGGLVLFFAVQKVRETASRAKSQMNLKQIGMAMHNHNSASLRLPPAAICDKQGKPLLSWRVAILPYIEQAHLYNQFRLDEPWDSPNNKKLIAMMPKIYAPLDNPDVANEHKTYYRVFHGKGAGFEGSDGIALDSLRNTSETIMVVEAGEPVIWTKPEELDYDDAKPLPALGGVFPKSEKFNAIMFDGAVRTFNRNESEAVMRTAIRRTGGERIDKNKR